MAKRQDQEGQWDLIRHAVGLDYSRLREAPMHLVLKNLPSCGPTVLALSVAVPEEDTDAQAKKAVQ